MTNESKNSAVTPANTSANSASPNRYMKPGEGNFYDSYLTYDEEIDPISGRPVFYDGIGTSSSWSNQSKS